MPIKLNHLRERLHKAQEIKNCILKEGLHYHIYENEEAQLVNLIDEMIENIADEIKVKEKHLTDTMQK